MLAPSATVVAVARCIDWRERCVLGFRLQAIKDAIMTKNLPANGASRSSLCGALFDANEKVMDAALTCLRHSSYPDLCKVTCQFYEGVLTLQGVVGSYFLKQLAHTAVAAVKGVEEVANRLDVEYPADKKNPQNRA
jgi:osmotically-inducible protein OsmY